MNQSNYVIHDNLNGEILEFVSLSAMLAYFKSEAQSLRDNIVTIRRSIKMLEENDEELLGMRLNRLSYLKDVLCENQFRLSWVLDSLKGGDILNAINQCYEDYCIGYGTDKAGDAV